MDKKRGVKRGTLRGSYKTTDENASRRIIDTAERQGDWKAVADANEVNIQTARRWIRMNDEGLEPSKKGGPRNTKLTSLHVDRIVKMIEENNQLTLEGIKQKLTLEFGITVHTSTIHRHLKEKLYTVKKVTCVPATANSPENRQKRADFVRQIMRETASQKEIYYQDETNINLFCRRREGRSVRGVRCRISQPSSRGPNVHCWGLLGKRGLAYSQVCRESIKADRYNDIMLSALDSLLNTHHSLENVVVVIDNAPSHSSVERAIAAIPRFNGVKILRLAPYSAPLSPIEYFWSSVKSHCKAQLSDQMSNILSTSTRQLTQGEHRLRALESVMQSALNEKNDSLVCEQFFNHVQQFYADIIDLKDLLYSV